MASIYCTKKLFAHLKQPVPIPRGVEPSAAFEVWYANLILLGRVKHILCCEAMTNCYLLIPAKVIHSKGDITAQLEQLIRGAGVNILARADLTADQIVALLKGFKEIQLEYHHNRHILGLMNDAVFYLKDCWESGIRDLSTLEDGLMRRLQSDGNGSYQTPFHAINKLLSKTEAKYDQSRP